MKPDDYYQTIVDLLIGQVPPDLFKEVMDAIHNLELSATRSTHQDRKQAARSERYPIVHICGSRKGRRT